MQRFLSLAYVFRTPRLTKAPDRGGEGPVRAWLKVGMRTSRHPSSRGVPRPAISCGKAVRAPLRVDGPVRSTFALGDWTARQVEWRWGSGEGEFVARTRWHHEGDRLVEIVKRNENSVLLCPAPHALVAGMCPRQNLDAPPLAVHALKRPVETGTFEIASPVAAEEHGNPGIAVVVKRIFEHPQLEKTVRYVLLTTVRITPAKQLHLDIVGLAGRQRRNPGKPLRTRRRADSVPTTHQIPKLQSGRPDSNRRPPAPKALQKGCESRQEIS